MPQFAGFWRRLAAIIIDAIIVGIVVVWPIYLYYGSFHQMNLHPLHQIFVDAVCFAYYAYFLSSRYQATPGKRLMGVYITTADDYKRLAPLHVLSRYLVYCGPSLLLIFIPFFFAPPEIHHFSAEDKKRAAAIYYNYQHIKPISAEEGKFFNDYIEKQKENAKLTSSPFFIWSSVLGGITLVYLTILVLTIALTREKTGIHDMICKTRALVGRPEDAKALT